MRKFLAYLYEGAQLPEASPEAWEVERSRLSWTMWHFQNVTKAKSVEFLALAIEPVPAEVLPIGQSRTAMQLLALHLLLVFALIEYAEVDPAESFEVRWFDLFCD